MLLSLTPTHCQNCRGTRLCYGPWEIASRPAWPLRRLVNLWSKQPSRSLFSCCPFVGQTTSCPRKRVRRPFFSSHETASSTPAFWFHPFQRCRKVPIPDLNTCCVDKDRHASTSVRTFSALVVLPPRPNPLQSGAILPVVPPTS